MEPRDQSQGQPSQDRLDKWLDAALHEYGSAKPRMGLEARVLANLATEKVRGGVRRWWVLGAAAATACVGIVIWVGGMNHRSPVSDVATNATAAGQEGSATNGKPEVERPMVEAVHRRVRPGPAKRIEVAREPRLSQFPSPRGLSEQEQLLVRYVEDSPDAATLAAKEQADWQKELQELSGDEFSRTDSDQ